jgi:hypothetical protein
MATPAQTLANSANAQASTGPRSPEGKARSSRNALTHGLSAHLFSIPADQLQAYTAIESGLINELQPAGPLEGEAVMQIVDAVWRLRRIRALIRQLAADSHADPFAHPESLPAIRQLYRYRATAEMQLYRAIGALRELQSLRLARLSHLEPETEDAIPPLAAEPSFRSASRLPANHRTLDIVGYLNDLAGQLPLEDYLNLLNRTQSQPPPESSAPGIQANT